MPSGLEVGATAVKAGAKRWEDNSVKCTGLLLRGALETLITGHIVSSVLKETIGKTGVKWNVMRLMKGGVLSKIKSKIETKVASNLGEAAGEALGKKALEKAAEGEISDMLAEDAASLGVGAAFGPLAEGIVAIMDVVINITTLLTIASAVMFGIENAGAEVLMNGLACNINDSSNELIDNPCSNGYINDDGDCRACKQIYNMKDFNYNFENNYNNGIFNAKFTKDPAFTGKLSKLLCRDPNIDKTTYSVRPFPSGACINWSNDGSDLNFGNTTPLEEFPEGNIDTNTFILSSGFTHCRDKLPGRPRQVEQDTSWDKTFEITAPPNNYIPTPDDSILFYKQLSYLKASPPTDGECASPSSDYEKLKCHFKDNSFHKLNMYSEEKWEKGREYLDLSTKKPYYPMTYSGQDNPLNYNYTSQEQHLSNYDDPNVCNNPDLELAGATYEDMIGGSTDHTLSINKKTENVNVSNHCCPKIVGAPRCPFYNYGEELLNITSSPSEFMDRVNTTNDYKTDNCYIYDKRHPEFLPKEYYDKFHAAPPDNQPEIMKSYFNRSITKLRKAGIQCGPKDKDNAMNGAWKSIDGETYNLNEGAFIGAPAVDVIRPDGVQIQADSRPTDPGNNYYGTRFKLRNNYLYDSEEDSGATGYENYLDPENYIYLPCNQDNTCDGKVSKFFETNWSDSNTSLYEIDNHTTINDVIARENGHPHRMKPLCDNYICNDFEKTKYMQTVYDGLCSDYTLIKGSPAPLSTGLSVGMFPLKNKYKKFYRPAGINNYDTTTVSGDKEYYSDICCDPVPFSNKWSFVGCDANGKNPYFIDQIIQDYNNSNEPTLPSEEDPFTRERINPQLGEKQNLNQCIPSMETKCTAKPEYLNAYLISMKNNSSPSKDSLQEFFDEKERCESVMDNHYINNMLNKDIESDKNIIELCESKGCTYFFPNLYSDSDIYKSSPNRMGAPYIFSSNENEYWYRDPNNGDKYRYPEGYVPTKGYLDSGANWSNNWTTSAEKPHNSVPLNQPVDNYTECNAIPSELRINDIEIYDKRIDWDKSRSKLRFRSDTPPPPHEELFKIYCKYYPYPSGDNSNMNNIPSSPTYTVEGDTYYYNVSCFPSPQAEVWEERTTRERVNTINLTYR